MTSEVTAGAKLRWGILSTAKIGLTALIPAIQSSRHGAVVAIASRDEDKARATAERLGIPTAHGSYDALLEDPSVDAVYNPLPNHLHVPWSIKALEAGKHVLCEKPIGIDAADAARLVTAAAAHDDLVVMEAFMYRFHPQWQLVKDTVTAGDIGEVRYISHEFSYFNEDPDNIRHQPAWGGGALLDIGCYPISQARFVLGAEPQRVCATTDIDPRFGTDRLTAAILDFGTATSVFTVATQAHGHQRCQIVGTTGRIEVDIPVNAPADTAVPVTIVTDSTAVHETGPVDQYGAQTDAMARAIWSRTTAPWPLDDAVANMKVLDAVRRSGEAGGWIVVD